GDGGASGAAGRGPGGREPPPPRRRPGRGAGAPAPPRQDEAGPIGNSRAACHPGGTRRARKEETMASSGTDAFRPAERLLGSSPRAHPLLNQEEVRLAQRVLKLAGRLLTSQYRLQLEELGWLA